MGDHWVDRWICDGGCGLWDYIYILRELGSISIPISKHQLVKQSKPESQCNVSMSVSDQMYVQLEELDIEVNTNLFNV